MQKPLPEIQEIEQSESWIKISKPPTGLHQRTGRPSLHITMPNKPPLYNRNKPNPQYTHLVITGEVRQCFVNILQQFNTLKKFSRIQAKNKKKQGNRKREITERKKKKKGRFFGSTRSTNNGAS